MSVTATPAARATLAARVECAPMGAATRGDALALLGRFLRTDGHYLASSAVCGGLVAKLDEERIALLVG